MDTIDGNYSVENKTSSPLISDGPMNLGLSGTLDLSHTLTDVSAVCCYVRCISVLLYVSSWCVFCSVWSGV